MTGKARDFAERIGPHLETAQTVAGFAGGAGLVLGLLSSIDALPIPRGPEGVAWILHPLFFLLGVAGGVSAAVRGRQVDRRRWEVLEDPMLTDGERETAHREAERERRWAGTVFFMAPLFLAYWMAYQFGDEDGGFGGGAEGSLVADLLILPPMIGFLAGLLLAQRALGPEEKPY